MELARDERDNAYRQYDALTAGIKELKMHRNRRTAFFHEIMIPTAKSYLQKIIAGRSLHEVAGLTSHILYFVFVFLLFVLAAVLPTDPQVLAGFALVSLYLKSSLGNVMGAMQFISNGNVAMGKIEDLRLALSEPIDHSITSRYQPEISWQSLKMHGIVYQYNHENGDNSFTLGPLDLDFRPGELVFIIGGNGDGKTTLAKVLTGLYPPQSGEITLDDVNISFDERGEYRKNFSVLFSDYYLFDQFLGISGPDLDERAEGYLQKLLLDRFVKVQDGRLSTTELSSGQRKRLALMSVYLEDRSIYVFDEWAAGQDPVFKDIFYQQLLPELQARGKLVIVISHDDQYYQLADRVIKLNFGRIVSDIEANR
jgi:putative ATP-binding cassette transporter